MWAELRGWAVRFLSLFRKRQLDRRLDEELSLHLELSARDRAAGGMSPQEARRAARLAFAPGGSIEPLKEELRARRGVPFLETLAQDLRYAWRMLRKSPGFTAVALLSLGFGIGTNSAIFSVVDALLLKGLPVADADRLVVLSKNVAGAPVPLFSFPAFRRMQESGAVCSGVIGVTGELTAVVRPLPGAAAAGAPGGGEPAAGASGAPGVPASPAPGGPATPAPGTPSAGVGSSVETAAAELVSGNFFSVLGVGTAAGRPFTAAEDTVPGGHPLAVLSYGYWQRRFGRDPGVVGQVLLVNGVPVTVVGVARRGFRGVVADQAPDLFLPVTLGAAVKYRGAIYSDGPELAGRPIWEQVNDHWLVLLARRRPGVAVAQASAVLDVLFQREKEARLATRTDPQDRRRLLDERLVLEPGARGVARLRAQLTLPLLILLAVAGLVLLIACANVANLLLARADRRRKEMAVRLGIGAGRGRLLRQLLTESLLLAGLGGALGVACAGWGSRLLLGLVSRGADPVPLDVDLDWRKLAFAGAVALATGVGFGLAPALQATRVDLASSLKQGGGALGPLGWRGAGGSGGWGGSGGTAGVRPGGGRPGGRRRPAALGRILVAAQIAMSLLLLIGAGLFVRSLRNLLALDTGFAREGVVLIATNPSLLGYDDQRLLQLYPRLIERLEAVPGVRSASLASIRLLGAGDVSESISLPGYTPRPDEDMDVQQRIVTPGYFETQGIPLVAGRRLGPLDRQGAPRVVVVNQALVRRFLGRGPALGKRFGFGPPANSRNLEIVGVVGDSRSLRLADAPPPTAYLPVAQRISALRDVEVRLAGSAGGAGGQPPAGIVTQLRHAIAEVEPNLPVFSVITMGEQLERSLSRERAIARLTGFFGLLALLLAAVGLYGVTSYGVARRTAEIGLRMALGAARGSVVGIVLRDTALLVAAGLAAGLAAAVAAMRLAASQLYGLTANDPATLLGATAAMAAVALAAGFLPARRAAGTSPMEALRHE